jgi:hypothetical protein
VAARQRWGRDRVHPCTAVSAGGSVHTRCSDMPQRWPRPTPSSRTDPPDRGAARPQADAGPREGQRRRRRHATHATARRVHGRR